jgi:hypothetical protein
MLEHIGYLSQLEDVFRQNTRFSLLYRRKMLFNPEICHMLSDSRKRIGLDPAKENYIFPALLIAPPLPGNRTVAKEI